MKKATLTLGAGLILLTGWLLVPDIASAQALKTPIEGRWDNISGTGEPERVWVDEDGIRHVRGKRGWLRWVGNVRGWESWLTNWDDDRAGETWFEHGTASGTGRIFGKDVAWEAHYTLDCTGPFQMRTCIAEYVGHLEDGRLLKVSGTWVRGDPAIPYTGILLDPPGLGPVKRNRPRRTK
jgi:hypothetical protein